MPSSPEPTRSKSLAEAFPEEQARLRELRVYAEEIGPPGAFYRMMLDDLLRRAEQAAAAQDTVAMLRVYQEMREWDA